MRDWPSVPLHLYDRAIFIDRDGTLSVDSHFPHRIEDLSFIPRALDALRILATLPVHIIVVTNQAGIGLGLFSRHDMTRYNTALRQQVESAGGRIDAIYFCPHKEPKHLGPDESACKCAKPAPGMLLEAAYDFSIHLQHSVMIGDKLSDIAAGQAVGTRTILVQTGKAGRDDTEVVDAIPDLIVADLYQAIENINLSAFTSVSR
jgi:D-glycero-D-manno-heptose 1,7-bisphosphate phosphatase